MASLLVALVIAVVPLGGSFDDHSVDDRAPGDALTLDATPVAVAPTGLPTGDVHRVGGPETSTNAHTPPGTSRGRDPIGLGLVGAALAAGAVAHHRRRDDRPYFVLVHGHGGSPDDFDDLIEMMGVDPSRTVAFDYGAAFPGHTSTDASRVVRTSRAAAALDALIRRVAMRHTNVYSIHHSRGGAVGVEVIAALDSGVRPPIDGYRGAALLDPAIGTGSVGWLQSVGGFFGAIPDNGRFDPIRCDDDGCRDIRAHLGDASGVEVIAIRNPDALITNFTDQPQGLRVYDLVDDGKPSALASWSSPFGIQRRIFEAHSSVRHHEAVADCIIAEATSPGSCEWKGHRRKPRVLWWSNIGPNYVR